MPHDAEVGSIREIWNTIKDLTPIFTFFLGYIIKWLQYIHKYRREEKNIRSTLHRELSEIQEKIEKHAPELYGSHSYSAIIGIEHSTETTFYDANLGKLHRLKECELRKVNNAYFQIKAANRDLQQCREKALVNGQFSDGELKGIKALAKVILKDISEALQAMEQHQRTWWQRRRKRKAPLPS